MKIIIAGGRDYQMSDSEIDKCGDILSMLHGDDAEENNKEIEFCLSELKRIIEW